MLYTRKQIRNLIWWQAKTDLGILSYDYWLQMTRQYDNNNDKDNNNNDDDFVIVLSTSSSGERRHLTRTIYY